MHVHIATRPHLTLITFCKTHWATKIRIVIIYFRFFYPSHVSRPMINNLIIFNLNINGIPKHFSSLVEEEVMLNHFDVLTFCETKLTNDIEK